MTDTDDTRQPLAPLADRELDALVAEAVFGWSDVRRRNGPAGARWNLVGTRPKGGHTKPLPVFTDWAGFGRLLGEMHERGFCCAYKAGGPVTPGRGEISFWKRRDGDVEAMPTRRGRCVWSGGPHGLPRAAAVAALIAVRGPAG